MFKHLVNKPSVETVTGIIKNAVEIEQVGGRRPTNTRRVVGVSLVLMAEVVFMRRSS